MTDRTRPVTAIENSVEIDAAPEAVWEIVSDPRRSPEWSAQAVKVFVFGRPKLGTWSVNVNRQNGLVWPTTAKIVEFVPGRRIANKILENSTRWVFEIEPTATGTRLVERRETPDGISRLSRAIVDRFLGGEQAFTDGLVSGVSSSLQRIKMLAEQG